ncbi:MAG: hypothetical protein MJ252_23690 [archaeon]|nr:hypothetical protein [archaeon]
MGCGVSKESIEADMLILRLERVQIQEERDLIIQELEKLTGKKVIRAQVPDYLSHSHEEEKTERKIEVKEDPKKRRKSSSKKKKKKKMRYKTSTKEGESEIEKYSV